MGRELGRISGPLLAENLLRNGNNLAFETNLLYLNVVNGWLGVKTSTPIRPLTVNGTARTNYLLAPNGTTESGTFNLGFTTHQIKNLVGNIVLAPNPASNPTVATTRIGTPELRISSGLIQSIINNNPINLTAATGRQVIFTTDTLDIGGNLHATGDITWDGNITFGNAGDENDTVTFYSEVASNIIPDANSTYDLGRASPDRWRHLYTDNLDVSALIGVVDITITNLTVDGPGILRDDVILANTNFKSTISNSLIPTLDNTYKIGTSTGPKRWKTLFLTGLDVDGIIDIRNNTITTLNVGGIDGGQSNLTGSILDGGTSFDASPDLLDGGLSSSPFSVDLELVADGLGNIYVTSTDVRIVNDLTVDGNSVVTDVSIAGQLDLAGDWGQTGLTQRNGNTDITGSLTVNGANTVQFQEIAFVSNQITTTTSNNNLELVADGLGIVKTLSSDVEITNDLDVLLTAYTNAVNVTTSATASDFTIDSIYINNNTITTNTAVGLNTDLELLANTTGIIRVTTTDVAITNDLTVDSNSTLATVNVGTVLAPATLSLTGDWNQTGAVDRTGNTDITGFIKVNGANIVQFDNIKFDSNRIVATVEDSDLKFTAGGIGIVKVLTSDVEIDLDLDVTGDGFFNIVNVDNTVVMDEFTIDDIYINDNKITTNIASGANTDLELSANGLGIIHITTTDVAITNDLTVDGNSTLANVVVGQASIPASVAVQAAFGDSVTYDFYFFSPLWADQFKTASPASFTYSDNSIAQIFTGATFSSVIPNGPYWQVTISNYTVNSDTWYLANANRITYNLGTFSPSNINLTGDWNQTGAVDRTGNTNITGFLKVNGVNVVQFDNIKFDSNQIASTIGDSDLIFTANGLGIVKVLTSDVEIDHDLDVTGDGFFATVNVDNTVVMDTFTIDDIYINDNKITTNTASGANTNLILEANGAGQIYVPLTDVVITNDLNVDGNSTLANVNVGTVLAPATLSLIGDWDQTGAVDRTGNTDITGSLTVNGANTVQFDDIQIVGNKIATTVGPNLVISADGALSTVNVNGTDVTIDNNLIVDGAGSFGTLEVTNTIDAVDFTVGNIYITNNVITTTSGNLILGADNAGQVQVDTADVEIANNLTAGALTVNGNTSVLNTVIRTEVITPTTTQTAQNVSGTSTPTGFFFYGWADDPGQVNPPFGVIQVGWSCVEIPGSVVTVVGDGVTNYDITITGGSFASGGFYSFTGDVVTYGPANAVQVGNIVQTGTFGLDGNFESGTITGTGTTSFLTVPDIKIDGPVISATAANTDLLLSANGYGGVRFDRYLKITGNDISSIFDTNNIDLAFGNLLLAESGDFLLAEDGDNLLADTIVDSDLSIVFTPNGTGNLVINSNKAFAVAVGNNTNRVLRDIGEIRQNSTNQVYEGRLATGNARFTNIYDADFNTYITPELTPGANDNTLRFGINGTVKATISSTELYSNSLHIDNVSISNTTINNLNSSTDLEFIPNGDGVVNVNEVYFKGNTITNTTDGALTLVSTGTGYVRFGGKAVIFPVGNNSNRGPVYELGETRYNTQLQYLEVYDGTNWVSAGGTSAYATLDEIQAELDLWSLILG